MQEISNSTSLAMELHLYCINPSILWAEGIQYITIVSMLKIFVTFSCVQIWQLFLSKEMDSQIKLPSRALSPQIILIDCGARGDYCVHYILRISSWFGLVLLFYNINTLRQRKNGWYFADYILKLHFLVWKGSLKFVPKGLINNKPV